MVGRPQPSRGIGRRRRYAQLEMMRTLHRAETEHLVRDLSRSLNATYIPPNRVSASQLSMTVLSTPTGKIAVFRRQDTYTLPHGSRGSSRYAGGNGLVGANRVAWTLDRGGGCRDVHKQLLAGGARVRH